MKLNLTYVNRTQRNSAAGKPFTSLSIKATQYGEKYLSGFGNKANENWKVGDEVEVAAVNEVVKGDKTYLNFDMPKSTGGVDNAKVEEVLTKLGKIDWKLDQIVDFLKKTAPKPVQKVPGTDIDYPEAEGYPTF